MPDIPIRDIEAKLDECKTQLAETEASIIEKEEEYRASFGGYADSINELRAKADELKKNQDLYQLLLDDYKEGK